MIVKHEEARALIRRLREKGIFEYPKHCVYCGEETKIEAHHDNYNIPNRVAFLCKKCHNKADHNKITMRDDDYVVIEHNLKPSILTDSESISIRINEEIRDKAIKLADSDGRTLSNWIRQLIKKELEK